MDSAVLEKVNFTDISREGKAAVENLTDEQLMERLQVVNFQRPEMARQIINQWSSDQTDGRIPELILSGIIKGETALILTSAVCFRAAWMYPFDASRTQAGGFTLLDGVNDDATGEFRLYRAFGSAGY